MAESPEVEGAWPPDDASELLNSLILELLLLILWLLV